MASCETNITRIQSSKTTTQWLINSMKDTWSEDGTNPKIQHNHKHPTTTPTIEEPNNKECLFLHLDYHRDDIPRNKLRDLYNLHCKYEFSNALGIKQTTICYSRPKTIKDLLTKAKLHQALGREASKFYSGELL